MTKRKRRKFSGDFKRDSVRLVREGRKNVGEVARDLDLTESAVRMWVKQAEIDEGRGASGALSTAEREELQRLRRQCKQLEMEREIPRKATAFFARESR